MARATSWLKLGLYAGRLGIEVTAMLPYTYWSIWQAKKAFRTELLKNGVPRVLAEELTASYNRSNKQILGSLRNGAFAMRGIAGRVSETVRTSKSENVQAEKLVSTEA